MVLGLSNAAAVWIGAGAAILGGLFSGLVALVVQERRATAIARQLRRAERQEETLLDLERMLAAAIDYMAALRTMDRSEFNVNIEAPKIAGHLQRIQNVWDIGGHRVFNRRIRREWERAEIIEKIKFYKDWPSAQPDPVLARIPGDEKQLKEFGKSVQHLVGTAG